MRFNWLLCAFSLAAPLAAQVRPVESQAPRAARLILEHDGAPITDWVVLKPGDELALTIKPVDALGNPVPISGFELWIWDPKVLGVASQDVGQSQAVVRFQSRSRGQTTVQIRASGVRQWVLVNLTQTVLAISPGRPTPPGLEPARIGWTAGGRFSAGLYNYSFNHNVIFDGQYGVVVEGYGGAEWPSGVELVGGLGFGMLGADSLGRLVKPSLLEGYVRADYAMLPLNKWRPVVSAGWGVYRARTGTTGAGIWNTSFQLLLGAGADVTVGPTTVAELRVTTRQLFEMTSSNANGYVGALWLIGAGLRARF